MTSQLVVMTSQLVAMTFRAGARKRKKKRTTDRTDADDYLVI
jgi:hypothetical protein